jgi:hypothetical protein
LNQLLEAEPCCKVEELQNVLDNLLKIKLIHRSVKDEFIMSTDLHKISLYDFCHKTQYYLPQKAPGHVNSEVATWQANLNQYLSINAKQQHSNLNISLDRLYRVH